MGHSVGCYLQVAPTVRMALIDERNRVGSGTALVLESIVETDVLVGNQLMFKPSRVKKKSFLEKKM